MVTSENPDALASYRFARGAAIILGVLIALALAALVIGFAFRSKTPHAEAAQGAVNSVALPEGARIVGMDVTPGRIVLRIHSDSGDEVDIVDSASGKLIGRVRADAPRKKK